VRDEKVYKGIVNKTKRQKLGHAAASHNIVENRTQPQRHAGRYKKKPTLAKLSRRVTGLQ